MNKLRLINTEDRRDLLKINDTLVLIMEYGKISYMVDSDSDAINSEINVVLESYGFNRYRENDQWKIKNIV